MTVSLAMKEGSGLSHRDVMAKFSAQAADTGLALHNRSLPMARGLQASENGILGTQLGPNRNGRHW